MKLLEGERIHMNIIGDTHKLVLFRGFKECKVEAFQEYNFLAK
jgi:hypothetical protein